MKDMKVRPSGAADGPTVLFVVYDGIALLDLTGPMEVFGGAIHFGADYRLVTASPGGQTVRPGVGPSLQVDCALEDFRDPVDTLILVGSFAQAAPTSGPILPTLRRLSTTTRRLTAVCTGAFTFAAAGLLDGRPATTHWAWCGMLAGHYPKVQVQPDAIYVRDGNVATSAGVSAGIDLALALIEEDHGADLARQVAKNLVVFLQRPGGQSQFSMRSRMPVQPSGGIRAVLDAVTADPAADHSVANMAGYAALSVRHFARMFQQETGTTPARYLEQVRVEAAQALLESRSDSMETIARRTGLGSAETMRRAFLRTIGSTPSAYRARFRTTVRKEQMDDVIVSDP
ncbi:GlxA family transcriptional regulator [Streptomyces chartreusis]